jgi:hypothetical protein
MITTATKITITITITTKTNDHVGRERKLDTMNEKA